jgi:hypothetical protein
MTLWGRVGGILARPELPDGFVQRMSQIGRPGVQAILPLEAAVLAGRSGNEAKRSGWLGFQERFIEELVVAVVWLWGVKTLGQFFDRFHALNTAIDWSGQKTSHVDLTPMERYTRSTAEARKLMRTKGFRLGFSVISTLLILGVVIPWLNQLKTKWIIDRYFHKKPEPPPTSPFPRVPSPVEKPALSPLISHATPQKPLHPTGSPLPFMPAVRPSASLLQTQPAPLAAPLSSFIPTPGYFSPPFLPSPWPPPPLTLPPPPYLLQPLPYPPWPGATSPSWPLPPGQPPSRVPASAATDGTATFQQPTGPVAHRRPVQFGAGLTQLGHWIENTDYGSILVTDMGIMAGRTGVAAKRSPFEALEIAFRDGLSLYFYVRAVPDLMNLMGKLLNKGLHAAVSMDSMAAKKLDAALLEAAQRLQQQPGQSTLSMEALRALIEGAPPLRPLFESAPPLNGTVQALGQALRTAPLSRGFGPLFQKEVQAYFNGSARSQQLGQATLQWLTQTLGPSDKLDAQHIGQLIQQVERREGAFASLSLQGDEPGQLVRAIKQAFRHTAGATPTELLSHPSLKPALSTLTDREKTELIKRFAQMAESDTTATLNSILQRALLLSQSATRPHPVKQQTAQLLGTWLERATSRSLGFHTIVEEEMEAVVSQLNGKLPPLPAEAERAVGQVKTILTQKRFPANGKSFFTLHNALLATQDKGWEALAHRLVLLEHLVLQEKPLPEAAKSLVNKVMSDLLAMAPEPSAQPLLRHYQQTVTRLLKSEGGHLVSLERAIDSPALLDKLKTLLLGGLQRDERLLKEALRITGALSEDGRLYAHPEKLHQMRHAIEDYGQTFLRYLSKHLAPEITANGLKQETFAQSLNAFSRLSRNGRILSQFVAIPLTMLGLGLFVPKLQFWVTRLLTGKDEHPGIAAVSHGSEGSSSLAVMPPTGASFSGPPLNRRGFQAFQQGLSPS